MKFLVFLLIFINSTFAENKIIDYVDNLAITSYDLSNFKKISTVKDNYLDNYILILKKRIVALNSGVSLNEEEKNTLLDNKYFLKQININYDDKVNKDFYYFIVESNYLWFKYIREFLSPNIQVKDSYVENVLEYMNKENIKFKYNLSEIIMYFNSNKEEIFNKINNLYKILNYDNFDKKAKEFSQSLTSKDSGYLGWVFESDLNKDIIDIIKNTSKSDISEPKCFGDYKGFCIIIKINNKERVFDVSDDVKSQIKLFIFNQLLENEIRNKINSTKFNDKHK